MLACARLGAMHSRGVRRVRRARARGPDRRRHAEADRLRVLRHRGQAGHRVQADPRHGHRRGGAQAEHTVIVQRPQATAAMRATRPGLARAHGGRHRRPRPASPSTPPTRSTSSTPPAPPGSRRAWSGTTAATRSRWPGRCATSTTRSPGEVFWAASDIGWVVGHSYIVYAPLLAGLHHDPVRGQAGRHPRRRRVLARHRRAQGQDACSPRRRASARSARRTRRARSSSGYDLSRLQVPVPGGRAPRPGHLPLGGRPAERPGHRPLVADGDRLGDRRRPDGPRPEADQARLAEPSRARI